MTDMHDEAEAIAQAARNMKGDELLPLVEKYFRRWSLDGHDALDEALRKNTPYWLYHNQLCYGEDGMPSRLKFGQHIWDQTPKLVLGSGKPKQHEEVDPILIHHQLWNELQALLFYLPELPDDETVKRLQATLMEARWEAAS